VLIQDLISYIFIAVSYYISKVVVLIWRLRFTAVLDNS
jgi:hypothetical protein